ncbi:MAG: iron chelate uptake ABC transporter family permease subunit, partial [Chloroflexota bacterium]|nr:iron chelate uptake ABC transporter family permease subunit [Chloroflexota bacterium]
MKLEDAVAVETRPLRTVKTHSSTRQFAIIGTGLVLLTAGLVMSTALGAVTIGLNEVLAALFGEAERVPRQIVWNLRVPRALVGALVGMNLAVAGALLQGIMRNPMAAPTIVGVTAGAGLAAAAVIILLPGVAALLPPIAFLGALAASVFVYVLSWQPGIGTSPVRMVLAGVAVTTMLG